MKEIIIDFDKMSDTKEVYGQKHSKFYTGFIYALVGILLTGVLYSCFGRIEMVAHASGIVRPNDDVSSVSSVAGGKVKSVYYTDGQNVTKGDVLYILDTSETEIALESLKEQKEEYAFQLEMNNRFIHGIRDEENPFSDDIDGPEYKYYIRFEQYHLSLKNTEIQAEYDLSQTNANLDSANRQITDIDYHINGLNQYKNSVESGNNMVSEYPEYADQYLLYDNTMQSLQHDYEAKRRDLEISTSEQENAYYLDSYRTQKSDYDYLIRSVESGQSAFPANNTSHAMSLFDDYINTYNSYLNNVGNASKLYQETLAARNVTIDAENELKAEKDKLKGYELFRDSVNSENNCFVGATEGVSFQYLYEDYLNNLAPLDAAVSQAEGALAAAKADPSTEQSVIDDLTNAYNLAVQARDDYKTSTVNAVNASIISIQTSVTQKEAALATATSDIDVVNAKTQSDNAEMTAASYKAKMLAQCKQTAVELEQKITSLENSSAGTKNKSEQLSELDRSYQDSKDNQYHQTLSQIESAIDSLEKEKLSVESSRRLNEVMKQMQASRVDDNGQHLSVSMATVNQLATLLSEVESLEAQINSLETQIGQTEKQIEQATVIAERDGVVNSSVEVVEGDVITAGTVVATIIPGGESVRGKMILPSFGKEFFPPTVSKFFCPR